MRGRNHGAKTARVAIGSSKGSELVRWDHCCGECGAHISIFSDRCPECHAEFDMTKPFVSYKIES